MTSFDFRLEPGPAPRLAALATIVHVTVAASSWYLGVPAALATILSISAIAGLASTLASLPGAHHVLHALVVEGGVVRARLAGTADFVPATLGAASRSYAGLAFVDVQAGSRRCKWLLTRGSLAPGPFRRLKAWIRFSC